MVIFGFGWIKPIALDRRELRWGALGEVVVALVALLAVIGLAVAAELLRNPLIGAVSGNLPLYGNAFLELLSMQALAFVLINLLPFPPLAGSHFLAAIFPQVQRGLSRYGLFCAIAAAAFVASGLAEALLAPVQRPLARWLFAG